MTSQQALLDYCKEHALPGPLVDFIKKPSQTHLCLYGGQHDMFRCRLTDESLKDVVYVLK